MNAIKNKDFAVTLKDKTISIYITEYGTEIAMSLKRDAKISHVISHKTNRNYDLKNLKIVLDSFTKLSNMFLEAKQHLESEAQRMELNLENNQ